jgi:hypothetical protein
MFLQVYQSRRTIACSGQFDEFLQAQVEFQGRLGGIRKRAISQRLSVPLSCEERSCYRCTKQEPLYTADSLRRPQLVESRKKARGRRIPIENVHE